jgi:hypothetical protein
VEAGLPRQRGQGALESSSLRSDGEGSDGESPLSSSEKWVYMLPVASVRNLIQLYLSQKGNLPAHRT